MSKKVIVGHDGPPCPRCKNSTQVREHVAIGERELRRPFYYSRWFCCVNEECRTTLIMPKEFIVWNDNAAAERLRGMTRGEAEQQLTLPGC